MENKIAYIIIITLCFLLIILVIAPLINGRIYNDNTKGMIVGIFMALLALASGILLNKNNKVHTKLWIY